MRQRKKQPDPLNQPMPGGAEALPGLDGPTSPDASATMAAGGLPIVRGNSNKERMTPPGHATVNKVGANLAAKGGATEIVPGTSQRTMETAQDLNAQGVGPVGQPQPGLESHALGNLEGKPKTSDVKAILREMVKKYPMTRLPGKGALSGRPAESEREFEVRTGQAILGLMQKLASNPQGVLLVPTSTQVIKFVKAWVAKGMPDDFQISHEAILKDDGGKPGDIDRFFPEGSGNWQITAYKLDSPQLPPGIYLMRHGETASTTNPAPSDGQHHKALIVQSVMNRDWKGAQKIAREAAKAGTLTDQDIEDAIDQGLPDPETAQNLMPHDLLSVVSAAGPQKRAQLMPILQQHMANLNRLPPDAQQQLKSHLGRLGA